MKRFPKGFLVGAASAAHQVEGNNRNNDIWALEHMAHGSYPQESGEAADFYHTFDTDFAKLEAAGLNAVRFSLEWARIEPEEGRFDEAEVEHYRSVIRSARAHGLEPMVTLFHFSSPVWLIRAGGWESKQTPVRFARYVRHVCECLGDELSLVCTINEANLGTLIAGYIAKMAAGESDGGGLQMGMDLEAAAAEAQAAAAENIEVFGTDQPAVFPAPRTPEGTQVVLSAHRAAMGVLRELCPHVRAGLSLSLHDLIAEEPGGRAHAQAQWDEEFETFLPGIAGDDYLGVQNYTCSRYGAQGELPVPASAETTEMGYEFWPAGLARVLRRVAGEFAGDLYVTENGIATTDDMRRVAFANEACEGVAGCLAEGLPVRGYFYWTMIDNYEWQSGYDMHFGLMALDRATQAHTPHPSLSVLGAWAG